MLKLIFSWNSWYTLEICMQASYIHSLYCLFNIFHSFYIVFHSVFISDKARSTIWTCYSNISVFIDRKKNCAMISNLDSIMPNVWAGLATGFY